MPCDEHYDFNEIENSVHDEDTGSGSCNSSHIRMNTAEQYSLSTINIDRFDENNHVGWTTKMSNQNDHFEVNMDPPSFQNRAMQRISRNAPKVVSPSFYNPDGSPAMMTYAVHGPPSPPMMDHRHSRHENTKRSFSPQYSPQYNAASPESTACQPRHFNERRRKNKRKSSKSTKPARSACNPSICIGVGIGFFGFVILVGTFCLVFVVHDLELTSGRNSDTSPFDMLRRQAKPKHHLRENWDVVVSDKFDVQGIKDDIKSKKINGEKKKDKKKIKASKTATKKKKKPDEKKIARDLALASSFSDLNWQTMDFKAKQSDAPLCSVPVSAQEIEHTLVTQVSEDRLWMLGHHCARWPGPISAVVFTEKTIESVYDYVLNGVPFESPTSGNINDDMQKNMLTCPSGKVTLQTFNKIGSDEEEYPVNKLRNKALSVVRTSHVMYVDIDFWLSDNLYNTLQSDSVRQQLADDSQLALVVPAFQIPSQCKINEGHECRTANIAHIPRTKEDMVLMVNHQQASAFDPTNKGGHGSTRYGDWNSMDEGSIMTIPCVTSNRYEPYLAFRFCEDLPPFQDHFTGYGKNKMTQIMHMRRNGYLFKQLGGSFLVHYPHMDSKSRKEWNVGKQRDKKTDVELLTFKRGRVDKVFAEFRCWLENEIIDDSRTPMCSDALDDDEKLLLRSEDKICKRVQQPAK
eukprot:CAMPEP_0194354854 /NCGR_PEP_ID=MMETSP0174-20130528/2867_1 /TAXON_ID=216777 /ORGANISM="Proboscia alata, Strain PI-D3" /LENGTH=687 /DNA_ID=CAMNT_0039123899 /DNA_START=348 /DNA_END=2411 /DNA_ORIENTATION=-